MNFLYIFPHISGFSLKIKKMGLKGGGGGLVRGNHNFRFRPELGGEGVFTRGG